MHACIKIVSLFLAHIFMFSLPNNSILLRILSNQSKQVCSIENLLAIEVKKTCSCTTSHAIKNYKRLEENSKALFWLALLLTSPLISFFLVHAWGTTTMSLHLFMESYLKMYTPPSISVTPISVNISITR